HGHVPGACLWTRGGSVMTADDVAAAVGSAAAEEMTKALERIKHCLGQLDDAQVWWRAQPSLNSIGNVILHLCGNVRQWIVSGLGNATDDRNRPAEFAERGPIPKGQLIRKLDATVDAAKTALGWLTARQLLDRRTIQGFDVTALAAIFDS